VYSDQLLVGAGVIGGREAVVALPACSRRLDDNTIAYIEPGHAIYHHGDDPG
jgi:hypothetical protein